MSAKSKPALGAAVKSAERALAILEYFRENKHAATVTEIACALGLPQSSTTMLLNSLLKLGYLDYTPQTRKFRPTYRVAVLGSWSQRSLFESGPLTDTMDAIGNAIGETGLLGLQNGPHMQYVHIVVPGEGVLLTVHVGILRPMTCSALGRMLLIGKTNDQIRAIVRRNNADAEDSLSLIH